jgi:hypothetical protein
MTTQQSSSLQRIRTAADLYVLIQETLQRAGWRAYRRAILDHAAVPGFDLRFEEMPYFLSSACAISVRHRPHAPTAVATVYGYKDTLQASSVEDDLWVTCLIDDDSGEVTLCVTLRRWIAGGARS